LTPWFSYPPQQYNEKHAIVVGAGIAGCQISWHLSALGWRVTLLEREKQISAQASGNLAGIISPLMSAQPSPTEHFYQQAFEYTTAHLKHLISSGVDIDWFGCGLLQLAHSNREQQRLDALKNRHLNPNLIQLLSSEQASKLAGIPCHYSASYFPNAGFINPTSWCNALLKDASVEVATNTDVTSLRLLDNRTWSVDDSLGKPLATAEVIILSGGKDLNQFSQSKSLALTGVLGQTTLAPSNELSGQLTCAINHEGYLTPAYHGRHVFGATFNREFDAISLNPTADAQNLTQLHAHLPELARSFKTVDSGHASVRSASPDRMPYVGGLPDLPFYHQQYASIKNGGQNLSYPTARYLTGLYTLGGLGSRGLTSSPLCAKALSELIDEQVSPHSHALLKTLHPARFLMRQLKRGTA